MWGPAWIDIHWNIIWLRVRSHITSHYTRGSITTLDDFEGVLGWPLDTFSWAVTISWSRLLARVWSCPKCCKHYLPRVLFSFFFFLLRQKADRSTPKHKKKLTTWQVLCQVEHCQPLPCASFKSSWSHSILTGGSQPLKVHTTHQYCGRPSQVSSLFFPAWSLTYHRVPLPASAFTISLPLKFATWQSYIAWDHRSPTWT